MIWSKASADDFTVVRYRFCSEVGSEVSANSVMPRMAFIGVLISWLMLDRNLCLARL